MGQAALISPHSVIDSHLHESVWQRVRSMIDNPASNAVPIVSVAVDNLSINRNGSNQLQVKDGGITTIKIADANVTTPKIVDGNVTAAKIASNAVTTSKILAAAVTLAKLDPTGAASGQVIGYNGSAVAWLTPSAGVTGSGTASRSTRWTSGSAIGNGGWIDTGGQVGIGAIDSGGYVHIQDSGSGDTFRALSIGMGGAARAVEVVHTGSNDALYVAASGGTTAGMFIANGSNHALYGIRNVSGATTPVAYLKQDHASNALHACVIEQDGTGDGLRIIDNGTATPSTTSNNAMTVWNGGTRVARLTRPGNWFAAGYTTGGADFAHALDCAPGTYEVGDVIIQDVTAAGRYKLCDEAQSKLFVGVVSETAGFVAGLDDGDAPSRVITGHTGELPAKVVGPVSVGDCLCTTADGKLAVAPPYAAPDTVVARAAEALASGVGLIKVIVGIGKVRVPGREWRAGEIQTAPQERTKTVTFSSPLPDAGYHVDFGVLVDIATRARALDKTRHGFTLALSAAAPGTITYKASQYW